MTRLATIPALILPALCLALAFATADGVSAQALGHVLPSAFGAAGAARRLPHYEEATELVCVGRDGGGRAQWLRADAASAWHEMRHAANADGVTLLLISGFRSVAQQRQIFERKLGAGQTLEDILAVNVPPGFSQHHSGAAVDLGTPGNLALLEDFEHTAAFRWLRTHAQDHGFSLSYPRGNAFGITYEPWHWAFEPVLR